MNWTRALGWIAGGLAAPSVALLVASVAGVHLNTSPSIPLGLYWTTRAPVVRGAYVLFCPPPSALFESARARGYLDRGLCPGAYGLLMKRVVAEQGDHVRVSSDGIEVNGTVLPGSVPLPFDAEGQPLPRAALDRTLEGSEVFVVGDASPVSFDGRYFGPIDRAQIQAVIEPVFTW